MCVCHVLKSKVVEYVEENQKTATEETLIVTNVYRRLQSLHLKPTCLGNYFEG
jgi:hypothetical protein